MYMHSMNSNGQLQLKNGLWWGKVQQIQPIPLLLTLLDLSQSRACAEGARAAGLLQIAAAVQNNRTEKFALILFHLRSICKRRIPTLRIHFLTAHSAIEKRGLQRFISARAPSWELAPSFLSFSSLAQQARRGRKISCTYHTGGVWEKAAAVLSRLARRTPGDISLSCDTSKNIWLHQQR